MPQKILVIGGVALGPKAACRCKRLLPDAEVTLIDENVNISYGGCGIPYYVSGEVNTVNDLRATPYNVIRDPKFFAELKDVTVRIQTRATAIDRAAKIVRVKNVVTGEEDTLSYDKLVLATGASPRVPPVEGHDLGNVLADHEDVRTVQKQAVNVVDAKALETGVRRLDEVVLGEVIPGEARLLLADAKLGLQEHLVTILESPDVLHCCFHWG